MSHRDTVEYEGSRSERIQAHLKSCAVTIGHMETIPFNDEVGISRTLVILHSQATNHSVLGSLLHRLGVIQDEHALANYLTFQYGDFVAAVHLSPEFYSSALITAQELAKTEGAEYVLFTDNASTHITGCRSGNYAVAVRHDPAKTLLVAIDFFAFHMDANQGKMHVLAITAKDEEEPLSHLELVYGGTWKRF